MNAPPPPASSAPHRPQIRLYQEWLAAERGLSFADYDALWRWSTTDLAAFWQSIWDYFELESPTPHKAVLAEAQDAGRALVRGRAVQLRAAGVPPCRRGRGGGPRGGAARRLSGRDQPRRARSPSRVELARAAAAGGGAGAPPAAQGVRPGDRVAAYMPNNPEAIIAFLAVASIGAVWSICAPDMGTNAVLDRFRQIEPRC
jgi:acetoacetyl-CoA synthetase